MILASANLHKVCSNQECGHEYTSYYVWIDMTRDYKMLQNALDCVGTICCKCHGHMELMSLEGKVSRRED